MIEETSKEVTKIFTTNPKQISQSEYDDPFNKSYKDFQGLGRNAKRRLERAMQKAITNSLADIQEPGKEKIKSKEILEETGYNFFGVVSPPYNLDYLAKLYEISAANSAAIDAKVSNIVGLGYSFTESPVTKRKLDRESGKPDRIKKMREKIDRQREALEEVLDNLNPNFTFQEILTRVYTDYETVGVGYIEVGRNEFGNIAYLGHISSKTVRIRQSRDGFVQVTGRDAVFFRNFGDTTTKDQVGDDPRPNELIMISKYTPTSSFYGVPDIVSAKNAVVGTEFAERYNLDYFENKAVPRYLITLKGATLSQAATTSLLEFFESGLRGKNHRSLFIPLPPDDAESKVDFKIEPIEAKTQDQSFEKYIDSNLNRVLMAHRVPRTKVSISGGSIPQAVAIEAAKGFKEEVCKPAQRVLAKKVNKIVKELQDMLVLEFNELTLTDADTQSKIEERQIRNKIRTPNEIRGDHGWSGLEGGDEVVELKPQQAAEARAQQGATRERDRERSAGTSSTAADGRGPKGEGRTYS